MSEKDKNQEATISLLNSHYYQQRRIAGYHARNEIEFLKNKIPPGRLEHYGYKVYSQNDEDGIIEEIFNRIGVSKGVAVKGDFELTRAIRREALCVSLFD